MVEYVADQALLSSFIGAEVISRAYGSGVVNALDEIDDDYKISIDFSGEGSTMEKSFFVSIAFKRESIKFASEEYNNKMRLLLNNKNSKKNGHSHCVIYDTNDYAISHNPTTNYLIKDFIEGNSFSEKIITLYGNNEYENDLYSEAFTYLEKQMNRIPLTMAQKACVVVALSFIALKYYNGDLFSFIENKYRETRINTEANFSNNVIQNAVREILKEYKERVKYFDEKSFVAVPLVLCCVPHYRINDLFVLAYDIYKKKLLFDEEIEDEQIREKITETLANLKNKDLISDSDTIKGTNYLMSKYTQSCIYSGVGIESLVNIITNCIRLIINHLTKSYVGLNQTSLEDSFLVEPYYYEGYNSWVKSFESDNKERNKFEQSRVLSRPYFRLFNQEIHLFTGEYMMDDSCDPNDVHIVLYSDNQKVDEYTISDPNLIECSYNEDALGGYKINRVELELKCSPIDSLSYSIEASGKEIYHSKDRLYRNVLFFDGKGFEVSPGTEYDGEIFVLSHKNNEEEYGEDIHSPCFLNDCWLYSLEVNSQDVFRFDDEPYFFNKITGAKMIGYNVPWADFKSVDGKTHQIYKDITILFQTSCEKEDIIISVDDRRTTYGEWSFLRFNLNLYSRGLGNNANYILRIYNLEEGYHSIKLINALTQKTLRGATFEVLYDPIISKKYKGNNDKSAIYDINSSFFNEENMLYEYGTNVKLISAFVKGLGYGDFYIYPSSISYSIDGVEWFDIRHKFYLCDINESQKGIWICGPKKLHAFYSFEGMDATLNLKQVDGFETKYYLYLDYFRSLNNMKSARVVFKFGNKKQYSLNLWYYPKIEIEKCSFKYDEEKNTHIFVIVYEGTSSIKVSIKADVCETPVIEKEIYSGDRIEIAVDSIPQNAHYLTTSLYGKKYGSLFSPYQSTPFFESFKWYYLESIATIAKKEDVSISTSDNTISFSTAFTGSSVALLKMSPKGINNVIVFEKKIYSGESVQFDISKLPFDSYYYCVFPSKTCEDTDSFSDVPILKGPINNVKASLLHRNYKVSCFIFKDGNRTETKCSLRFNKYEVVNGYYCLSGKLANRGNDFIEVLVYIVNEKPFSYEARMFHKKSRKYMAAANGKTIDRIIIDK